MNKLIKQTVYLPVKIDDEFWTKWDNGEKPDYDLSDVDSGENIESWVNEKEGYFFTPEQLNEYTANVIKQTSVEFANWIAYTKKHGGVKPLQEALIQYKLKSTEELFDKYLEMSK